MANRRLEPTSYRPFRVNPNYAEGLLAVEREGGDLERKVAIGMARMAEQFGQQADLQAEIEGRRAGARAAFENGPTGATVSGGEPAGTITARGTAGAGAGVRVVLPPAQIKAVIAQAAQRHGVDEHALTETARLESGFNPSAQNSASSAGGLFQFVDGTARQYGLANKLDAGASADAAARLMRDNGAALAKALGRAPTAGELYLAHQQGSGGALKLLTTPFAKAADLVGAEAVRLNGGSPDMLAGDFAKLWTDKVESNDGGKSFATLPSASSVAPMAVTEIRSPVSVTPGKTGTFRPSGSDTIYGRAFNAQGTRTYLEMADAAMVQNQQALFEAYGDNPAMLEKALGEGLTADLRDNVFEEIAPEYQIAYTKRAAALMSKARAAEKDRQLEANRAEFLTRTGELETLRGQKLAGLNPNDPNAAADLADVQASIDAHFDSAVARGVIDAGDAVVYKQRSRSEATVGFYSSQARGKSADEIEAMQAEMRQNFAAGELDGVTADDWGKIENDLTAQARARRTQDETATSALKQRGVELVNKIARGQPIDPADMTRFQLDVGTATDGRKIASSTFARMRVADALRKMPIADVEGQLEKLLKGEGDQVDPDDLAFARTTIADFRQAIQTDPLGKAEAIGLIPPVATIPLDGTVTSNQIAAAVAYRKGAADAVAKHFGVAPRYFRPGETEAVMKAAEENPEALVTFTRSVRDAFGSNAGRALSEFSESGPALAHAAGLSIATGDDSVARDVATALSQRRQKALPELTPEVSRRLANFGATATTGALIASARTQNAALQTAQLLFQQDAVRLGLDPADIKTEGSPAQTAYLKALDRSLGGRTVNGEAFGGIDEVNDFRIITPADMKKGEPQSLVENLTDDQLAKLPKIHSESGYPLTASQLRGAHLISDGDGIYRVALGDPLGDEPRYLTTDDGGYWRLDIRELKKVAGSLGNPDIVPMPLFNMDFQP